MKNKQQISSSPMVGRKRRKRLVESETETEEFFIESGEIFIECRRSVVDVRQILSQWRSFRQNDHFTG